MAAQTLFSWPADNVDVATYATVWECLSATQRVQDSMTAREPILLDTMPMTFNEAQKPLPTPVVTTAQRCGARFESVVQPLDITLQLQTLFLLAGKGGEAFSLVQRRLAALQHATPGERVAVMDSMVSVYLRIRPILFTTVDSLLQTRDALQAEPQTTIRLYHQYFTAAKHLGDSIRAQHAATRMIAVATRLTDADREDPWYKVYGRMYVFAALAYRDRHALLDVLQHKGAAEYVAIKRAHWVQADGLHNREFRFPIGEHAPRIGADFWFPHPPEPIHPAPGKLSIVTFLFDSKCQSQSYRASDCFDFYATLKRLHRRFPELNIVIVTQTHGWFGAAAPPSPAQEADWWRQWLLEFHNLPATLAITTTPFFRLPDLDRRRIEDVVTNVHTYSFGGSMHLQSMTAFLVDRDGTILHAAPGFGRTVEEDFVNLLAILAVR